MDEDVNHLLLELNLHPILIDVGASGSPPKIWEKIARHSIYLGFDPDQQNVSRETDNSFYKKIMVNAAITSDKRNDQALFYFTKSPFCSSILKPDHKSLSNFLFSDLFRVEKEARVPAITLDSVMEQFALTSIDWLKVDSQGVDLRIVESLKTEIRSRLLALDIEPGLIDAYEGEDLFVDAHRLLTQSGFWLSRLDVFGSVRIKKTTLQKITTFYKNITPQVMGRTVRESPGWVEARYLRTAEWLAQGNFDKRQYLLLWIFSILDGQYGFALDLAMQYEKTFGKDETAQIMKRKPILFIKHSHKKFYAIFSRLFRLWKH